MAFFAISPLKRILSAGLGRVLLCGFLVLAGAVFCAKRDSPVVDLLISNARIVDGTGNPWYHGWVAIRGERIAATGTCGEPAAVRKMTSLPAQRAGLAHRGVLRPGMAADLVVFDPATVKDRAAFLEPHQYPKGIETVIVNGEIVLERGSLTGRRPGKVLRRKGSGL